LGFPVLFYDNIRMVFLAGSSTDYRKTAKKRVKKSKGENGKEKNRHQIYDTPSA
jgi:hypothetical protein